MKRRWLVVVLFCACWVTLAGAQSNVRPIPKAAMTAKTIAIINDTHTDAVETGAVAALKRWGHFTIVDDPDAADITVVFEKKSDHEGSSTQKTGDDGKPESSYSMSFSSSVRMKARVKGAESAFFSTSSSESKKKAGEECITSLQSAMLATH